jgi:hypothetical protein
LIGLIGKQRSNSNLDQKLVTSWSQTKAAGFFNLPQVIEINGEPWRARTSDPLIKSQLLYQLS